MSTAPPRPISAEDLSAHGEALIETMQDMLRSQVAERRAENGHWHLDRKVPISIIIALLMQAAAGLWYIADLRKDVELLRQALVNQREIDLRQDRLQSDAVILIRADLQSLAGKLDRFLERATGRSAP
jgi:hypothetical protein